MEKDPNEVGGGRRHLHSGLHQRETLQEEEQEKNEADQAGRVNKLKL